MKIIQYGMLAFLSLSPLYIKGMMPQEENRKKPASTGRQMEGKKIGNYYFTGHVLTRMRDRGINTETVCWVLGHGNRYYNNYYGSKGYLCVDIQKEIGAVLTLGTNRVITVLKNMDQKRLDSYLAGRERIFKRPSVPIPPKAVTEAEKHYDEFEAFKIKKDL